MATKRVPAKKAAKPVPAKKVSATKAAKRVPAKRPLREGSAKAGGNRSALIDARIKELDDWRGETLARLRALIKKMDPDVVEEWKWRGVPVWYHDGMICTGRAYKSVVKLTFAKGASLSDPAGLFNSSLDGNVRRAIDFHEGEKINEKAFSSLIRAAIALNTSSGRLATEGAAGQDHHDIRLKGELVGSTGPGTPLGQGLSRPDLVWASRRLGLSSVAANGKDPKALRQRLVTGLQDRRSVCVSMGRTATRSVAWSVLVDCRTRRRARTDIAFSCPVA